MGHIRTRNMGSNAQQIANAFIQHYYQVFDSRNYQNLANLYQESSMLTFEGDTFTGPKAIVEKLSALPFKQVQHIISTTDCQPCPGNGLIVFVNGALSIDGDNQLKFAQAFTLFPNGNSFYVVNDLF